MRKTMKKLIVLLCVMLPIVARGEQREYTDASNVVYVYDTNTMTAMVKPGDGNEDYGGSPLAGGSIIISGQIVVNGQTYQVTKIGEYAFQSNKALTSVVISEGITEIDKAAFLSCSNLREVTLPQTLKSFGQHNVFANCGIENIAIPDGITKLTKYMFAGCSKLKSIQLPTKLDTIEDGVFRNCTSLLSMTIPKTVTTLKYGGDWSPFEGCSNLESLSVENGNPVYDSRGNCNAIIRTSTNELISGCKNTTIPASVTSLAKESFSGSGITSISIPATVKNLEASVFSNCASLTSVTFPDNIQSVPATCFYNCKALTEVVLSENTTSIGGSAFAHCTALTKFVVPKKVRVIEDGTFHNCQRLEQIEVPDGLERIGREAFEYCSFNIIDLPSSLKSIGEYAFSYNYRLSDITIPAGVTEIGDHAFWCTELQSLTSLIEEPFEVSEETFMDVDECAGMTGNFAAIFSKATLYVPQGSKDRYKATSAWNQFHPILEIGSESEAGEYTDPTTGVVYEYQSDWPTARVKGGTAEAPGSPNAHGDITILEKFVAGGKEYQVTEIGGYAFYQCEDITSVVIPPSVKTMGDYAFAECTNITSAAIPESITTISKWAFAHCTNLEKLSLPSTMDRIDYAAFKNCVSLKELKLPDHLTSIGSEAFMYCVGLKSVVIPKSLVHFDNETFDRCFFTGCRSLESFVVEEGNPVYDSRENCNGLILTAENKLIWGFSKTTLPESVVSIGDWAFLECEDITSITIPQHIKSIGYGAYHSCTGVTSITFPANQPDISLYAFDRLFNLVSVISKSREPKWVFDAFGEEGYTPANKTATLYIPKGTREKYMAASGWNRFEKMVEIDAIDNIPGFSRKIVVEEGTGTWCQWCPRGIVGMSTMLEKHPDTFIPIAVHVNDDMYTSDYLPLIDQKFFSYPTCTMNRRHSFDPNAELLEKYYAVDSHEANATIALSAMWLDEKKRALRFSTTTTFAYDMPDDYRIAYVICENQVGPYTLQNAYAGGWEGEMGGFEDEPSEVSILHNHVARYISSINGTRRTIPEGPVGFNGYHYDYDTDLPANVQNTDNIELIVLLINQETMEIENADRLTASSITAYNPTGISDVELDNIDDDSWYSLDGNRLGGTPKRSGVYIKGKRKVVVR